MNENRMIYEWQRVLGCLLGTFLYAVGINLFVVPASLYSSGLLGNLPVGKNFGDRLVSSTSNRI